MNNRQDKYKKQPDGFASTTTGRLVRTVRQQEQRRVNRAEHFARNRVVPVTPKTPKIEEPASSPWDREKKFRRWQVERDIKRKMEAVKKKPIFKVGIVHHKYYSPPVSDRTEVDPGPCHSRGALKVKKHNPTPQKRITRATQKRLEAKLLTGASTTPAGPVASARKAKRTKMVRNRFSSVANDEKASFAPNNYSFKAPSGLVEIPLFGRYAIPKIDKTLEKGQENPWPHKIIPVVGAIVRTSLNPLVRKKATDRSSSISKPPTSENSSLEPVTLKLSSKDSVKESNEADKPEEIDAEVSATIDKMVQSDDRTPPRSGTPVPALFSPYVVSSRGKVSARKERRSKMGMSGSPADAIPTKDNVMENLNISIADEENTARYFKFILQREEERLKKLCEKWETIMKDPDLGEDAHYRINQAVGQTKLLMRKKFERFRGLVSDCETGKGEMLVQCRDLQGFWDMISMEIDDCDSRLNKLDYLRSNGWKEDEFVCEIKKLTKKKTIVDKVKPIAKSSARSWIVEARKKKLSHAQCSNTNDVVFAVKPTRNELRSNENYHQSFLGSTRRSSMEKMQSSAINEIPSTLSTKLQSLESSISQICETPEVKLDDTISYVNSDQTPGKGILKKSNNSFVRESHSTKSTRKVDFHDGIFLKKKNETSREQNEMNEELQKSWRVGEKKIESYDEDKDYCNSVDVTTSQRVEKRLDFDDDSFNETLEVKNTESAAIVESNSKDSFITVLKAIPDNTEAITMENSKIAFESSRGSSRRRKKIQDTVVDDSSELENFVTATRVLRNRTVAAETTNNKNNRRSHGLSIIRKDDILIDSSSKENSDPLGKIIQGIDSSTLDNVGGAFATSGSPKRRKSTRKSIKFSADDCTVCTPKPALALTPRVRRSRKISLVCENSQKSTVTATEKDVISFDSSDSVRAKTRRSRRSSKY